LHTSHDQEHHQHVDSSPAAALHEAALAVVRAAVNHADETGRSEEAARLRERLDVIMSGDVVTRDDLNEAVQLYPELGA
jgi:hypothetical protein